MPTIGPITINDGASTPVAHTFTPIGRDSNGAFIFEQTTPAPVSKIAAKRIGYKQTRELDFKKQLTGSSKVSYLLSVPTPETLANNSAGITPPPTLAYRETARVEYVLAERSAKQERKDTRVLTANLMAHAMVVANVDDLEPSYVQ